MKLEYWLALNNARNLSPLVCIRLLQRYGSPQAILNAKVNELQACSVKPEAIAELQHPDWQEIAKQCRWAEQAGHHVLTLADERYPHLLKNIADPPPVLFVNGNPAVLSQPQIALVGSRSPSPGGLRAAKELAGALAQAGLAVTSGLALGVDGASHLGALAAHGVTIAVLGSGLLKIYPERHQPLAAEIAETGAVISEFAPEMAPLAINFPRRNRIISGLSLGVCVIEAALKSGSLITAKLAIEQGREVFAVPGSIYNAKAQGCHILIQEGAKLVGGISDILAEIKLTGAFAIGEQPKPHPLQSCIISLPLELDSDRRQLLQCVGFEPTVVDQIIYQSGLSAAQVTGLLLDLELKGYIQSAAGGYQRV